MATHASQIKTKPDPYEAFNIAQAYRAGDFIVVSGQAALDLEGNIVGEGDFEAQAVQAFDNLRAVFFCPLACGYPGGSLRTGPAPIDD